MSVVEHRPSRTHITQSWKNLTEKFRNFEQLQKCHLRQYNFKIDLKWFRLELEHSITPQPHPQILGGVANYGIKLWGTNAAFFVPQGPPGAGPGVGPAPPPSAAAPPGVHAQVAQNGTVYYHQPVRYRIISRHAWKTFKRAAEVHRGRGFQAQVSKSFLCWVKSDKWPPFSRTDINNKCGKNSFTVLYPRKNNKVEWKFYWREVMDS